MASELRAGANDCVRIIVLEVLGRPMPNEEMPAAITRKSLGKGGAGGGVSLPIQAQRVIYLPRLIRVELSVLPAASMPTLSNMHSEASGSTQLPPRGQDRAQGLGLPLNVLSCGSGDECHPIPHVRALKSIRIVILVVDPQGTPSH